MSKNIGKVVHCDNCDRPLQDYHGRGIPGEVTCLSSIFMSKAVLCKQCSDQEELAIEEAGTNDLPKLREFYKIKNKVKYPYSER